MRKIFGSTAILALACAAAALPLRAQETKPMAEKTAAGVRAEVLASIDDAREKLIALADATPAEKFGWRPGEGVRSTGEVFAHVSMANYFFPSVWGAKMPEGIDVRGLEKLGGDKAKMTDTLKHSFDHLRQMIEAVPDADLERMVKMQGRDRSVRSVMLTAASHAHEHLGQSIAYARVNAIVPPWSRRGE